MILVKRHSSLFGQDIKIRAFFLLFNPYIADILLKALLPLLK